MKNKNNWRIAKRKIYATMLLLELLVLSTPYAFALDEDNDVIDMVIPAILAAPKQITGTLSIPLNFPKEQKNYWVLGMKTSLYVKKKGDFSIPPPVGYKFCAVRGRTTSNSFGAGFYIKRDLPDQSLAHIYFDVPCGGGGISVGTINSIAASAVLIAATYFTAGSATGLARVAAEASYLDFLSAGAYTSFSVFGTTVASLTAQHYLSDAITNQLNLNYSEGACGKGDAGNWLITDVDLLYTREYDSCDVDLPQSWIRI